MPELTPEEAVHAPGPWIHRDVSANGARFHAVSCGEGPLVLLLHGFPMYWWTWRRLLPQLAEMGYRAVAVDMRGYGGSDHPPRGYDLFTLSRDTEGIIRSLGESRATVIGHDMGAMVAWTLAAFSPSIVDRLAAISMPHPARMRSALIRDRSQMAAMSYLVGFQRPFIPERQMEADHAIWVEEFLREWSADPSWPHEEESRYFRAAFQIPHTAHCALEYYRWAVRSIPRGDGRKFVSDISERRIVSPVLHIHGGADRTILPRSADGSAEFVDGPYAWRSLPGVGHFPHEEAPELVNSMLIDWLVSQPPWDDPQPEPLP